MATFDALSTFGTTAAASTAGFTHTPSAAPSVALVWVMNQDDAVAVSSVTYGGVTMTSEAFASHGEANPALHVRCSMYSLGNPASSAATVGVTMGSAVDFNAVAVTYTGASSSDPIGTPLTADARGQALLSITSTLTSSELAVDGYTCFGTTGSTAHAGDTARATLSNPGDSDLFGAQGEQGGSTGAIQVGWDPPLTVNQAIVGGDLQAAVSGPDQTPISDTDALTLSAQTLQNVAVTDPLSLALEVGERTAEGGQEDLTFGEQAEFIVTDTDALSVAATEAIEVAPVESLSIGEQEDPDASSSDSETLNFAAALEVGVRGSDTATVDAEPAIGLTAVEPLTEDEGTPDASLTDSETLTGDEGVPGVGLPDTDPLTLGATTELDQGGGAQDIADTDALSLTTEQEERSAEGGQEDFSLAAAVETGLADTDALAVAETEQIGLADTDALSEPETESLAVTATATEAASLAAEPAIGLEAVEPSDVGEDPATPDASASDSETLSQAEGVPDTALSPQDALSLAETTSLDTGGEEQAVNDTETLSLGESESIEVTVVSVDALIAQVVVEDLLASLSGTESISLAQDLEIGLPFSEPFTEAETESLTVPQGQTEAFSLGESRATALAHADPLTLSATATVQDVQFSGSGKGTVSIVPYGEATAFIIKDLGA